MSKKTPEELAIHHAERARALDRGYWPDGDHIVTRDGRRMFRPTMAAQLREDTQPTKGQAT